MLIIFDLDDTLVDTTGCITYHRLEEALVAMQGAGLAMPDFGEALALLRRLDSAAESARDALLEFVEVLGAEPHLFEVGIQQIYTHLPLDWPLMPLEGAQEALNTLALHHQLALVSNGIPAHQMDKLKKAGIDSRIFSKIAIAEERCKRSRYQMVASALGFSPSQVVVCGDRISVDLVPAKELGFKTIQMRWGRGLNALSALGQKNAVDYAVSSLREIAEIVKHL